MLETISEVPTLNLVEVNQRISEGLARVEEVKNKIELFKEESFFVKIIDENDKAGYAATKEFLSKVRPTRTNLENERKAVVKPFNDLIGNVNDAYKNATSQLAAIESPHKQEKEDYEAAEERRKAAAEAAKEKVINDKIAILLENGLVYNSQNGYWRNDSGRAITRMDIINMEEGDFERFLSVVKADYEKAQELICEEQIKQDIIQNRKNELTALGIPLLGAGGYHYTVTDIETEQATEIIVAEELQTMDENSFNIRKDEMVAILQKNAAYLKKIKDDAAALKQKAEQDEKDLKERESKLAEQELKMKRQQVEIFQSKLPLFKFKHSETLEKSFFVYENYWESITIYVSDIFDNDGLIDNANSEVEKLITKGELEAEKKRKDDIAEAAKQTKIKQDAEAKKKVLSRKEIGIVDPCVAEIFNQVAILKKQKLELINGYTQTFIDSLERAIERYNTDLRHLR